MIKKRNMLDVILAIKYHGPVSNADIVKFTGLTSVTATNFTKELVHKGLVTEEGPADSNGGRRALLYRFNPERNYIVSVTVSICRLVVGVLDLDLNVVTKRESPYDFNRNTVEQGIQFMIDEVTKAVAEFDPSVIAGIGISVPGPVGFERGLIYELTNIPKWRNIALKEVLEKSFQFPVLVDKDANCNAAFFKWIDAGISQKNLVCLSTAEGMGSGVILNGIVLRGSHGVAGEVGHISIHMDGERCNCGNYGCIEQYASIIGIVNSMEKQLRAGAASRLTDYCEGQWDRLTFDMITDAAKQGDPLSINLLRKAADYLCVCIDNVIKAYDPDQIILDIDWLTDFDDLFYYMINRVFERTNFVGRDDVSIRMNTEKQLFIKGAATLVLESLFDPENDNNRLLQ